MKLTDPAPGPHSRVVMVWDDQQDCYRYVTAREAAAGMIRYARSLGPGTAACGEMERQALALLRGEQ